MIGRVAGRGPADPARRLDEFWTRCGPSWQWWHVKDTTKGPAVWEVCAVRGRVTEEGIAGEE